MDSEKKKEFWNTSVPVEFIASLYRLKWWWPFYLCLIIWIFYAALLKNYAVVVFPINYIEKYALKSFLILSECSEYDFAIHLSLLMMAFFLSIIAIVAEIFVLMPFANFYLEMRRIVSKYFYERVYPLGYIKSFAVFNSMIFAALFYVISIEFDEYSSVDHDFLCVANKSGLVMQVTDIFINTMIVFILFFFFIGWLEVYLRERLTVRR